MQKRWQKIAGGMALLVVLLPLGCSDTTGPRAPSSSSSVQSAMAIVSLDRAQLSVAGVTTAATKGIFSIGWKKFVGPNVAEAGTIGEAYAVVQSETAATTIRPSGIDIGTVTLSFSGGTAELTKRLTPSGGVIYETFSKGFHHTSLPVNIPFVANGVYTFDVSGSSGYSAGKFQITAPSSLLSISGHANGDTVSVSSDLKIQWAGGSASDSVLVRIVPHLRPNQIEVREWKDDGMMTFGDHQGGKCQKGHREGHFMVGGPLEGMGPEFMRGIVLRVPNTGSYTLSAADLGALLKGTGAGELMVGVTQTIKQDITHDGGTTTVLLRNGDRLVLHVR